MGSYAIVRPCGRDRPYDACVGECHVRYGLELRAGRRSILGSIALKVAGND